MLELLGIVFGGISRLAQHFMDLKDKQLEREHEATMFDKQIQLQGQQIEAEKDMKRMDVDAQRDAAELSALVSAIQAQADEAKNAGGWVAKLSASVRPFVSYWLLVIYSASKVATLFLALQSGVGLAEAVRAAYTEFDGALLGSVISFWFADRSVRRLGNK